MNYKTTAKQLINNHNYCDCYKESKQLALADAELKLQEVSSKGYIENIESYRFWESVIKELKSN